MTSSSTSNIYMTCGHQPRDSKRYAWCLETSQHSIDWKVRRSQGRSHGHGHCPSVQLCPPCPSSSLHLFVLHRTGNLNQISARRWLGDSIEMNSNQCRQNDASNNLKKPYDTTSVQDFTHVFAGGRPAFWHRKTVYLPTCLQVSLLFAAPVPLVAWRTSWNLSVHGLRRHCVQVTFSGPWLWYSCLQTLPEAQRIEDKTGNGIKHGKLWLICEVEHEHF